jgi:hypothetical protein
MFFYDWPNARLVIEATPSRTELSSDDLDRFNRLVASAASPRRGWPLFLDGLAAFEDNELNLPLPASRLDYREMWTLWRAGSAQSGALLSVESCANVMPRSDPMAAPPYPTHESSITSTYKSVSLTISRAPAVSIALSSLSPEPSCLSTRFAATSKADGLQLLVSNRSIAEGRYQHGVP